MGAAAAVRWMLLQAVLCCLHAHQEIVTTSGFDDNQRQAIVDKHNEYRRMEEGTAMMRMEYDMTLEKYAQQAADQCNYAHTVVTQKELWDKFGGEVGENIFVTSEDSFPDVMPVNSWWEEINHYNFRKNLCAPNKECGHYKQVVWDSTRYVGCGAAHCPQGIKGCHGHHGFIVFCQYAPIGNWPGMRPYTYGEVCSGCPANASHCGDRLCSAHKHPHSIRPTDCLHADKQIITIEGLPTRCDKFLDKFGDGQCSRDVIREQCCETCSSRRDPTNPACPHGDKEAWCHYYVPRLKDYICNNTDLAKVCCDSCNYIHPEIYNHENLRHNLNLHDRYLHTDEDIPLGAKVPQMAYMQGMTSPNPVDETADPESSPQPGKESQPEKLNAQPDESALPETLEAKPEVAEPSEVPDEEPKEQTTTTTSVKDGVTTKVTETVIPLENGGSKTITRTEVIQPNGSISISTRTSIRRVTMA